MAKPAKLLALASVFLLVLVPIGYVFGQSGVSISVATHPEHGDHLVDGSGKALYLFTQDPPNESTCLARCGQAWPPLIARGDVAAGEGVDTELLATIQRDDGITQVTYADSPLYRYIVDSAGEAGGQGAEGNWYLVGPSGEPIGAEGDEASTEGGALPFSEEQASRGESAYAQHCSGCHQANLGGSFEAPELAGPNFRNYWGGKQVSELFNFASSTMPLGNPGGLDDGTYADILAYIFQENGFEPSGDALGSEAEALRGLTIPSDDPSSD